MMSSSFTLTLSFDMVNVLALCVTVGVQVHTLQIHACACAQAVIGKLHCCALRVVHLACVDRSSLAGQQAPKICLLLQITYTLCVRFST